MKKIPPFCFFAMFLMLYLFSPLTITSAHEQLCDPKLKPIDSDQHNHLRYRERTKDKRCEGLYASPINAQFEVLSYLRGRLEYKLKPNHILQISTPDIAKISTDNIHIRAIALPLRTYYRMDAMLPQKEAMVWPMRDVLHPARLYAARIGVFGWIGDEEDKIFIPLTITQLDQKTTPGSDLPIELMLRPSAHVERLSWRIYDQEKHAKQRPAWQLHQNTSIRTGAPLILELPRGETAILHVEVIAKIRDTDEWINFKIRVIRPGP